ncbi:hypothetical protein SCB29_37860, partial [Paraburkholderia sp. SIMBA_055]
WLDSITTLPARLIGSECVQQPQAGGVASFVWHDAVDLSMNAKAGFRSRNVEIASTVCIAYPDYSTASGSGVTIALAACAPEIATSDAA